MSNISDLITIHQKLDDSVSKRFNDLEALVTNPGSSKDTVAKVGEELRNFREIVFGILSILRQQIRECVKQVDNMETWNRRKALVVSGLPEQETEDCTQTILKMINTKLGLTEFTKTSIKACHRLGSHSEQRHRPILVRFNSQESKSVVWRSKTKLKGSSVSLKEFLTRTRQAIFLKSRLHFGMRSVWTLNGVIVIRTSDGTIQRITTNEELASLTTKFPKTLEKAKDNKS